jgi:hypothetical protein
MTLIKTKTTISKRVINKKNPRSFATEMKVYEICEKSTDKNIMAANTIPAN